MERKAAGNSVIGVSGGPDSVYLLRKSLDGKGRLVIAHLNHGARGRESEEDSAFVERLGKELGVAIRVGRDSLRGLGANAASGFEKKARDARRAFLIRTREECGASRILLAHTADDQVETVLMRIFEGAGISGLKGIPRRTADGIERPLLDTWRADILDRLRRHKIPYREDSSNLDTRFERNWIRHVLIPLLERRYGKSVRKRIFALGERFREIDEFLDAAARRWMKRSVTPGRGAGATELRLPRASYSRSPSLVRKRIVQVLCFERLNVSPNERLLEALDRLIVSGRPSARLAIGKGATLSCRYGEAIFRIGAAARAPDAGGPRSGELVVRESTGRPAPARVRRLAAGEGSAVFDADGVSGPFSVRPLRAGDRMRPLGAPGTRKVKEILIDRKVARDERWGRPVVCDARGEIVWIPGVVRSAIAPVTRRTRRTVVLSVSQPSAVRTPPS